MRNVQLFINLALLALLLLASGCGRETGERHLIDRAERISEHSPDSARALLDSIALPELLSPRLAARWCLLYGRLADRLGEEMPYSNQLEIALKYYRERKERSVETEIGLYLGRSYAEDNHFKQATQAYIDALAVAKDIPDYNRAGYICSYLADLYELDDRYLLAAEKNRESRVYFQKAGNIPSYIRAFVNEGYNYLSADSSLSALNLIKQAENMINSKHIDDTILLSYVYNGLGNIYNSLKEYDIAERYILKIIDIIPEDNNSNYLLLTDISINKGDIEKAEQYLQNVHADSNEPTSVGIAYCKYKIEKEKHNHEEALLYYERYMTISDSLESINAKFDTYEIEQKYNHLKLHDENINLRYQNQKDYIFILILILASIILGLCCLGVWKIKDISIRKKKKEIEQLNNDIYQLYINIKQKEKELSSIQSEQEKGNEAKLKAESKVNELKLQLKQAREKRIAYSNIAKKLSTLSNNMRKKASKEPLPDKIWEEIEILIEEVYPNTLETINGINLTQTERRLCLLTLFHLDNNEIANLLCVIPTSTDMTRYRVRKKLQWSGSIDFYESLVNSR